MGMPGLADVGFVKHSEADAESLRLVGSKIENYSKKSLNDLILGY